MVKVRISKSTNKEDKQHTHWMQWTTIHQTHSKIKGNVTGKAGYQFLL